MYKKLKYNINECFILAITIDILINNVPIPRTIYQ